MKAFLYKIKGAFALAVAMSLFCPQVFAVEGPSVEEPQTVEETTAETVEETAAEAVEETLPTLTFEEALKLAKKNSAALRAVEDQAELLHETRKDLQDMGVSLSNPTYDYKKWVNDMWYALTAGVFQVNMGMESNKISREVENLTLEVSVRSFFTSLADDQATLDVMKKNADIQQKLYVQGQTKRRLGMISKYELDQLKINVDQARSTVSILEAALEQNYIKFNQLIGGNPADRYELVYDLTFEPYVMTQTMEQYINDKINNDDLAIKGMELAVENAKFNMNYLSESDAGTNADQREFNYDSAKRDLKTAKLNKETLIRNTYLQIQQLESQYASAQADVAKAAADYRVAQINYQAGNVTKTTVELAELGLLQAENALKQLVYSHDLLVFTFENPTLLADTTAAASGASY